MIELSYRPGRNQLFGKVEKDSFSGFFYRLVRCNKDDFILKAYLFLILILSFSSLAYSDSKFDKAKEEFFKVGEESCLEKMKSIEYENRKKYCSCAYIIIRSKLKDEQLKKHFSGKMDFETLMKPVGNDFDACKKYSI